MKDRLGRLAYFWTGMQHVSRAATPTTIEVDDTPWFDDEASCVLLGNVGKVTGGVPAVDDAKPDDGWLEVGVATATGAAEWVRTLGRMVVGRTDASPFVRTTRAREITIALGEPRAYDLDGGDRDTADRLTASVVPQAITVCVPEASKMGSSTPVQLAARSVDTLTGHRSADTPPCISGAHCRVLLVWLAPPDRMCVR